MTSIPLFDPLELFAGDGPRARLTDPHTSHEAADSNQLSKVFSQEFVRALLERGPLADHELVALAGRVLAESRELPGWSPSRIRSARHELVGQGRVQDSGRFASTSSGRRAIIWEVTS